MKKNLTISGESVITVTLKEIKRRFDEYNKLYFEGKLPNCSICWQSKNLSTEEGLGMMNGGGKAKAILWINGSVFWTDRTLKNVIVHEMIHLLCHEKYGFNLLHHMWPYSYERKRIYKKYGFKFPLYTKLPLKSTKDKKDLKIKETNWLFF